MKNNTRTKRKTNAKKQRFMKNLLRHETYYETIASKQKLKKKLSEMKRYTFRW